MSAKRPMSDAPLKPILAVHYERGAMEIAPCHDANFWLPGRHWYEVENEEGGIMGDEEFEGWIAESAD